MAPRLLYQIYHTCTSVIEFDNRVTVKSIVGDIGDPDALNTAFTGASVVIHTAGIVSVSAFPDSEAMERVNIEGAFRIHLANLN